MAPSDLASVLHKLYVNMFPAEDIGMLATALRVFIAADDSTLFKMNAVPVQC